MDEGNAREGILKDGCFETCTVWKNGRLEISMPLTLADWGRIASVRAMDVRAQGLVLIYAMSPNICVFSNQRRCIVTPAGSREFK